MKKLIGNLDLINHDLSCFSTGLSMLKQDQSKCPLYRRFHCTPLAACTILKFNDCSIIAYPR